ncbi:MAG: hypothetical protein HY785_15775 [Oscillatoriophycideae cyanobacterium NC_groundwater_1537_Pr4_S-0.65um_50_18]|nr:hypothetical protein [Oscillatoriophycideae cyanobacterium NC_groundwater_1537_Pr4_S-0.65um_50_18]
MQNELEPTERQAKICLRLCIGGYAHQDDVGKLRQCLRYFCIYVWKIQKAGFLEQGGLWETDFLEN